MIKIRAIIKSQLGISLLESLVAVGVLGLIGAGFLSALSTGSRSTATLDQYVTAENLARSQLEKIKNAPYDGTAPYYDAYQVTPPGGYAITFAVTYPQSPDTNIQEIKVTTSVAGKTLLVVSGFKENR